MAIFNSKQILLAGLKGDKGDGLHIVKYYASVAAMNADYNNPDIAVGDTVAIQNSLDLYVKNTSAFAFVGSLGNSSDIAKINEEIGQIEYQLTAMGNGMQTLDTDLLALSDRVTELEELIGTINARLAGLTEV